MIIHEVKGQRLECTSGPSLPGSSPTLSLPREWSRPFLPGGGAGERPCARAGPTASGSLGDFGGWRRFRGWSLRRPPLRKGTAPRNEVLFRFSTSSLSCCGILVGKDFETPGFSVLLCCHNCDLSRDGNNDNIDPRPLLQGCDTEVTVPFLR